MKSKFFITMSAILALFFVGLPTASAAFCVEVNDVCCDGNSSSADHQMALTETIDTFFVYFDTQAISKAVKVMCYDVTNGVETLMWEIGPTGLCLCGTTYVVYAVSNPHLLRFKVICKDCPGSNCVSATTSKVKIYTPSTNSCKTTCP